MDKSAYHAAIVGIVCAMAGFAGPLGVDGALGTEWTGITPVSISIGPNYAPGGFGSPGSQTHDVSYDIYVRGDGNYYYAFLNATSAPPLFFANLYWDTNPSTGSDFGIEVTNQRAFRPGGSDYFPMAGYLTTATTATGIEIAVPWSFFRTDPLGIGFPTLPDNQLMLRLSQSFSYDVVGGTTFGDNRLGTVAAPEVPEPGSAATAGAGVAGLLLLSSTLRGRTWRASAPR